MSGLRRVRDRLRNRRGATLVLIGIMMTVMVGMTGAAVDFSRMYAFKAQLQEIADAGAMAGAIELVKGRNNAFVPDSSRKFTQLNHVNGADTAWVARDSVQGGTWDFTNRTFTPKTWGDASVNSVRVSAIYTAPYTFARIFGANTSALSGVAVAAVGYVGVTNCLKPWAVSYADMLKALPNGATLNPLTYNLTAADVQYLSSNQAPVAFQVDNSDPTAGGNIANVKVSDPWNGSNSYKDAISGSCANLEIGPGTWLDASPAEGQGTTTNAVKTLCGVNGQGQNAFACNQAVKLAVWDQMNGANGGAPVQYRVKFVGAFVITGYDPGNGGGKTSTPQRVTGYFSAMASEGGFTSTPTPLTGKAVLTL